MPANSTLSSYRMAYRNGRSTVNFIGVGGCDHDDIGTATAPEIKKNQGFHIRSPAHYTGGIVEVLILRLPFSLFFVRKSTRIPPNGDNVGLEPIKNYTKSRIQETGE